LFKSLRHEQRKPPGDGIFPSTHLALPSVFAIQVELFLSSALHPRIQSLSDLQVPPVTFPNLEEVGADTVVAKEKLPKRTKNIKNLFILPLNNYGRVCTQVSS
jgi:hypothetical protein